MFSEKETLLTLPGVIPADDDRVESYREDTMMRGDLDGLLIARDEKEVAEALAFCHGHAIPVTLCASQTSMTGASVPRGGLLISTEKLEGVVDIDPKAMTATVRPGTITADFQKACADAGFFFPVAPTSRDECTIGANIATNATGEDSYQYGPLRPYLEAVEIVLPGGKARTLVRQDRGEGLWTLTRAGYFTDWKDPIDLLIGSEGTLAFISKATFRLLPRSPEFFSALVPFRSTQEALRLVVEIASGKTAVSPRALELVDTGALALMKTAGGFPQLSEEIGAFLYIKQEFATDAERDERLGQWYELAVTAATESMANQILIAQTHAEQEAFRLWRHRIPECESERGRTLWATGGAKIGSDWWVPIPTLAEMMDYFYKAADASGLSYIAYAHIGMGHPHTNLVAKNPEEKKRANDILCECCRKAVALGGGVVGEHGLGKLHTDLLPIQYSSEVIERMKAWKREYDPKGILGRGNIFEIVIPADGSGNPAKWGK